ncbi:MAG TPA: HAMP domain-containing sensor histidine kinase [Gaiellaceae bacterium]|nr:HAMP domain-containing sensor histidine kinase [Gaiellaceae bacterium]
MVNEELARTLAASCGESLVVLDSERRVVAMSEKARSALGDLAGGRRLTEELASEHPDVLVLFLESPPELSAYQELRAGFTAAVSHELRTPLARLLVLLESATLPGSDVGELMEQARQEVEQARELIDDVLFLGELETGREVVALGSTRVQPIVEEVVAALADRADHAEITLDVRVDGRAELPLRPRMLRVVLENLVANAIRYAGQGSTCTVEVSMSPAGTVLMVSDDGQGVPPSDLPRLFERFYRGDQARTSRGTGLGLAIVKHVVTAAGGEVEATSDSGSGLAITARFPG